MSSQVSPTETPVNKASFKHKKYWPLYLFVVFSMSVALITGQYLSYSQALTSGALALCISLWATSYVPAYWPALALFAFATATHIAPTQVIFSGFQSSTFWLLFSGMVFGAAIKHTGLTHKATRLLKTILGNSYQGTIIKIALFSMGLAFLIPSGIGRVVLIIPTVATLAEHFGYAKDSNGRHGMLLAAAFGTFLPTFAILPANAPNMLLSGMAEALYGTPFSYWDYLLLHFPVLGLGKIMVTIGVILWLFPDKAPTPDLSDKTERSPLSRPEIHLMMILCACFAMWFTDSLHHISPGWIGLIAAIICLWPQAGLTGKECLNKDIQYGTLFFSAGIIGLGAIISHTGLGVVLVNHLTTVVDFSQHTSMTNLSLLTALSICVGMVTNLAGIPAIMTPLADHLAELTNLPRNSVLMTQVLSFSTVLLPFQAPPLITAIALGNIPMKEVTKVCLATFVITCVFLLPLDLFWWHVLGMF